MEKAKVVMRLWSVTVNRYGADSSPMAAEYMDRLVDMQVMASIQSLTETHEELKRIHEEVVNRMTEYDEKSRGFHRSAMYKGKMEAMMEMAHILVRELDAYEKRMETNKLNDGRMRNDQSGF